MSKRFPKLVSAILTVGPVIAITSVGRAQSIYTGPTGGDWNTAGNWSLGTPTGGVDARVNNNASNVVVNIGAGVTDSAQALTIDSGDGVTIGNNSSLNLSGNLSLAGSLKFLSTANDSYLRFSSPTATISGAGTLDLNFASSGGQARLEGPGSGTLTNTSTVRGSGYLREVRFTNAVGGVLENYQTTGELYLDANNGAAGLFVNRGTIRALAGSLVTFTGDFGGDFDNVGGAIQANGAGAVARLINNASVTGGTYSTSGGGEVVVESGHTASASGFANAGTFRIRNNARLNISGNINNTGTLIVDAGANESYLTIAGNTTLSGAGTTQLNGTPGGGSARIDGGGTLTIAAGHTVRGEGYFREMKVINNGTIIGDSSSTPLGGTYLDPNNSAPGQFVNNGTIQVTAGNYISLVGDFGGDFTGTGTYRADGANAFMHLANSVTVNGGTWTTTGGGEIRVPEGHVARMNAPTITAGSTVAALNNTRLYLNGPVVTNNGTIDVRSGASETYLTIESDLAFAGTGKTVLNSDPSGTRARIDGGGTLTIPAGYTVSGNGYFREMHVINNGLILADRTTSDMYLDPNNAAADLFLNNATIKASAGATVTLVGDFGGNFAGPGTYRADGAGSFVNLINNVTVVGGVITTTAGGVVQVPDSHTATMTDTTVSAGSTLTVGNNSRLNLNGSPILNGLLAVNSGANESYLTINGTTNLNVGTLALNSNAGVSNARVDGGGTLNIGANFTVTGNGYFREMLVNNAGTILADKATGAMSLDPRNDAPDRFTNTGTIKAAAGATVNLLGDFGGNFAGSGVYRADGANAAVNLLNNVTVVGGTYTTTAGGRVGVPDGHTATISAATISTGSTFSTANNTRLNLVGTVTNNGTLAVTSGANESYLSIPGDVTIAGPGTVRLTSVPGGTNARIDGAGTLTVGAGQTVAGNGYWREMKVVNNGTILADQATGSMYLDPNNSVAHLFVNNGTIRATAGATMYLAGDFGGNFGGSGAFVADGTIATINSLGGDLAADVTGTGTFRAESSSNVGFRSFKQATLAAASSGTARITAGGGNAGTSKVKAVTIDLPANGHVDVTDHGLVLDYTGSTPSTTIRGYLASGRNNGNWNGAGIMSSLANSSNGRAVGYIDTSVAGTTGTFLGQNFDATSILIRYTVNGDATLDGGVDFNDLVLVAQNYNSTGTVNWNKGDFTYDGLVNFDDLVILAQNYSSSLSLGEAKTLSGIGGSGFAADWAVAQSLAPEPTTLITAVSVLALGARRRARRA